jgi:predicted transcriptional regulator
VATRVELLEEAKALEVAGGDWTVEQAAAVLGVARATLFVNEWIMRRAIHPMGKGKGRPVRIPPSVIRLWQSMNTGAALARAVGDER